VSSHNVEDVELGGFSFSEFWALGSARTSVPFKQIVRWKKSARRQVQHVQESRKFRREEWKEGEGEEVESSEHKDQGRTRAKSRANRKQPSRK
jgi:hypothetical protein